MAILAVDIGTTGLKMGVFESEHESLTQVGLYSQEYVVNVYNDGLFADIEQEKWQQAFMSGCKALQDKLEDVTIVALSGTTPGLTAMNGDGKALYPAILMLDQRSRKQANHIINKVGIEMIMAETGNMPVAGGCSLASMLWLRENETGVYEKTVKFGHSNTHIASWLTGNFAIDPSSASLMALYNTVKNDLSWNEDICAAFEITPDRLPDIIPSDQSCGKVKSSLSAQLGFSCDPEVIIGGNDAVLAAYSLGIVEPGDVVNVDGTCEITLVCLPKCFGSENYNVRAHVLPDRWLTLHVMNAGGKAFEWFKNLFCRDMSDETFYHDFLPDAIDRWLGKPSGVTYVPFLMGSRYSLLPLKAELLGLTQETDRTEILAALVRGLCEYQKGHLDEISQRVQLSDTIHVTGGAAREAAMIRAKDHWMRRCHYVFEDQSSLKGAAMLGLRYLHKGD